MTDMYVIDPDAVEFYDGVDAIDVVEEDLSSLDLLFEFAQAEGDISDLLKNTVVADLGGKVVEDWIRDDDSRKDWKDKAQAALDKAAQENVELKDYPWPNAANVHYPILTVAALQFGARAYPGIVKGDEAISLKVFGKDPEGKKAARATRVKTFLNYQIFYKIEDWEADTDALIHQLPIIGCAFRKVWFDAREGRKRVEYVSAMRITVNQNTQSLDRAPRITHDFDLYPYEIKARQAAGDYRDFVLTPEGDDDEGERLVLEQHRLEDLDGDGVVEPYIVTVDRGTSEVLSIVPDFGPDDVELLTDETGQPSGVWKINRRRRFIKYGFLPDPKGRFYDIGFGHLLAPLMDVIDSAINMLVDSAHAQVAGGGFVASGLRLQATGQTGSLKFKPGEYKTVSVSGNDLRAGIVERTFPNPSPVLYQLLEMMLGAAKDIAAIKDVLSGESGNATMPVGTVLALIDQGLQVFTSIYKRIYRSLKDEYQLIYRCEQDYPEPEAYAEVVDDPEADFFADFERSGNDVQPVADPSSITKMQALAKAQFLMPFREDPTMDRIAINKRVLEAADIPNVEELMAKPSEPPPPLVAELENKQADTRKKLADAEQSEVETMINALSFGLTTGMANDAGPMGIVAGAPGYEGDIPGGPIDVGGPEVGMDPSLMGGGPIGPAPADGVAFPG